MEDKQTPIARQAQGSASTALLWSRGVDAFCALAVVAMFILHQRYGAGVPMCFDDCWLYVAPMWEQGVAQRFASAFSGMRPFPVPLIFSMFGTYSLASAMEVVQFQTLLGFASWTAASAALASLLQGRIARRAAFLALMTTMFARGMGYLHLSLLSDSLSASLQLLALSALVRIDFIERALASRAALARLPSALALLAVFALADFARPTNALFLCPIAAASAAFAISNRWRRGAGAAIACAALAAASVGAGISAPTGKMNLRNNVAARVLAQPGGAEFLGAEGWLAREDAATFGRSLAQGFEFDPRGAKGSDVAQGAAFRQASDGLEAAFERAPRQGGNPYADWMARRPVALAQDAWAARSSILGGSLSKPERLASERFITPQGPCPSCFPDLSLRVADASLADLFTVDALLGMCCALLLGRLALLAKGARLGSMSSDRLFGASLAIAASGALCALGSWYGDYWTAGEMARHALAGGVFFAFGAVGCFAAAAAQAIESFGSLRAVHSLRAARPASMLR